MKLTTQQAADVLGVSRPTVVKFIKDGKLIAERIGGRRMLQLDDVLAFQRHRRQAQYDFLAATAVNPDEESDPAEVRKQLAAVRKAVAARRRE
jgi:excisionase family DNA binding protein